MKKEIWGFYPPPIGGISIYCKRLAEKLHSIDESVIMRDFAKSGYESECVICVKNIVLEFFKLLFVPKKLIHAQFTNFYLLLMLYLFGWRHLILFTLHNRRLLLLKGWKRRMVNRLFKRVKYVIYNDPTYTGMLCEKYDVAKDKIIYLPTYIAPGDDELRGLPQDITSLMSGYEYVLSANASKLLYNVYGDVYGIDQMIELMNRLVNVKKMDVGLLLCVSEVVSHSYYNDCIKKIETLGLQQNIHFVINSSVNGFEVWAATDLFLRPTMSDMEGVSVKEALQFGTPVVASDVCSRPKEAVLYETGNADDLFEKVYALLLERKRVTYIPEISVEDEIMRIYSSLV